MERTVKISLETAKEWYKKGGNLREIALQAFSKKELSETYIDVCRNLFSSGYYYTDIDGNVKYSEPYDEEWILTIDNPNNGTSKQLKKLMAFNKLMNVAKYLNGDWKPKWNGSCIKYYIYITNDIIYISNTYVANFGIAFFKSESLARKAIEILGEDTIRLALSTDW